MTDSDCALRQSVVCRTWIAWLGSLAVTYHLLGSVPLLVLSLRFEFLPLSTRHTMLAASSVCRSILLSIVGLMALRGARGMQTMRMEHSVLYELHCVTVFSYSASERE